MPNKLFPPPSQSSLIYHSNRKQAGTGIGIAEIALTMLFWEAYGNNQNFGLEKLSIELNKLFYEGLDGIINADIGIWPMKTEFLENPSQTDRAICVIF